MVSQDQLNNTFSTVSNVLKAAGAKKVPLIVKTTDDCITAAGNSLRNNVVPIFCVSSVSGSGLKDIKQYLHLLSPGTAKSIEDILDVGEG